MFVIGLYLGFGVTFMASSVSIYSTDISLIDMYWYLGLSCTCTLLRLLSCFLLNVPGLLFHLQFLGVFHLAYIPKFSRLLNFHNMFRGF